MERVSCTASEYQNYERDFMQNNPLYFDSAGRVLIRRLFYHTEDTRLFSLPGSVGICIYRCIINPARKRMAKCTGNKVHSQGKAFTGGENSNNSSKRQQNRLAEFCLTQTSTTSAFRGRRGNSAEYGPVHT